ncbi:MAG: hypothetical protein RLZ97_2637 [Verrucomicrobiota bacterium]|jgi:hypothetical protein
MRKDRLQPSVDIIDPAHQPDTSRGGLPYPVVAGLELSEPAHLQDDQRPLAQRLNEIMKRQGVNRLELVRSMKWTRLNKSLRLLDDATRGKSRDLAFIRRIYECLGVSEETFADIIGEEKKFGMMRVQAGMRRSAHGTFCKFGPHLSAMLVREFRGCLPRKEAGYRHLCARVAYEITNGGIEPLSPSEVASAIQQDVTWLPRVAKPYVRAYIYHRMPDEAYVVSSQGVILHSGDWRCSLSSEVEFLLFNQHSHFASQSG